MTTEIGTYEAKTRLAELLREVRQGRRFTITSRGEPVAQLVPVEPQAVHRAANAIDAFLAFRSRHPIGGKIPIKELIEEGRE